MSVNYFLAHPVNAYVFADGLLGAYANFSKRSLKKERRNAFVSYQIAEKKKNKNYFKAIYVHYEKARKLYLP